MSEATEIQIIEPDRPELMFKIANPIMRFIIASPLHGMVENELMIMRWRGRKTDKEYSTPVGYHRSGDQLTVFTFSPWKANFRQPHPVEVKLKGEWRKGIGVLDDDPRHAAEFIKQSVGEGVRGGYRRFRMEIEGERAPTVEELIPEVQKRKMVLIKIDLK